MDNLKRSHIAECAMATLCTVVFFCFAGNVKATAVQNSETGKAVQVGPATASWLLFASDEEQEGARLGERQGAGIGERDFEDPDYEEHENLRGEHGFAEPEGREFEEHENLPRAGEGYEFRERGEFEEPEEHAYREREFQEHEEEFPDEEFFGWPGDELYGIPDEEFFEGPENFFEGPSAYDFYEGPENYEHPRDEEFFERHEGQGFEEPGDERFREEPREGIRSGASEGDDFYGVTQQSGGSEQAQPKGTKKK